MSKRESNNFWIIVLIIVLFVLYLASLGTISSDQIRKTPKAFRDEQEEAKKKHKRLVELIEKQKVLKKKLAIKFKRIYVGVRIGLVLIWGGIMATLVGLGLIENLGDFLNYTEVSVLVILTFNFLTFGSLKNFRDYVVMLKTRTENWVYGKYVDIDLRIESAEKKKIEIEKIIHHE
ncbi:MAG: hypothetical protein RL308_1730 [Bacteroidota bacterium]|jgi:ABC-type multidrug transport system fused ATPase/permease subunit